MKDGWYFDDKGTFGKLVTKDGYPYFFTRHDTYFVHHRDVFSPAFVERWRYPETDGLPPDDNREYLCHWAIEEEEFHEVMFDDDIKLRLRSFGGYELVKWLPLPEVPDGQSMDA